MEWNKTKILAKIFFPTPPNFSSYINLYMLDLYSTHTRVMTIIFIKLQKNADIFKKEMNELGVDNHCLKHKDILNTRKYTYNLFLYKSTKICLSERSEDG
jgi:hypothetical protein